MEIKEAIEVWRARDVNNEIYVWNNVEKKGCKIFLSSGRLIQKLVDNFENFAEVETLVKVKPQRKYCDECQTSMPKRTFKIGKRNLCGYCLLKYDVCWRCKAFYLIDFLKTFSLINSDEKITSCGGCCNNDDDNKYFRCYDCGDILLQVGRDGAKIRNKYYCREHYSRHLPIYKFDKKIPPVFYSSKNVKSYVIGFELEIEFSNDGPTDFLRAHNAYVNITTLAENAIRIKEYCRRIGLGNFLYLKADGSICGFEIVSHPFDWWWWKNNKIKVDNLFSYIIKDLGGFSYKTGRAGIHFHLSKENFDNEDHSKKLWVFAKSNYNYITKIAQRSSEHYCKFEPCSAAHALDEITEYYEQITEGRQYDNHYQAINWTADTIETRFFRGTLNFQVFDGIVEFIFAMISFVRNVSFASLLKENSWNLFLDNTKKTGFNKFIWLWQKLIKRKEHIEDTTQLRRRQ